MMLYLCQIYFKLLRLKTDDQAIAKHFNAHPQFIYPINKPPSAYTLGGLLKSAHTASMRQFNSQPSALQHILNGQYKPYEI